MAVCFFRNNPFIKVLPYRKIFFYRPPAGLEGRFGVSVKVFCKVFARRWPRKSALYSLAWPILKINVSFFGTRISFPSFAAKQKYYETIHAIYPTPFSAPGAGRLRSPPSVLFFRAVALEHRGTARPDRLGRVARLEAPAWR